ncbi:hypothetical protein [Bacillus sp. V5-8f]|uniref:hypothetical protein n=1 Tax=Bacillus sp. V5-8f TaxID=2053044 RepID=UPI0015E0D4E1|nr:hypothetical protein [Bacillus sp. V5-8f]
MILLFVLLTIVSYLLVMRYVLRNIQQPVQTAPQHTYIQEPTRTELVPAATTR